VGGGCLQSSWGGWDSDRGEGPGSAGSPLFDSSYSLAVKLLASLSIIPINQLLSQFRLKWARYFRTGRRSILFVTGKEQVSFTSLSNDDYSWQQQFIIQRTVQYIQVYRRAANAVLLCVGNSVMTAQISVTVITVSRSTVQQIQWSMDTFSYHSTRTTFSMTTIVQEIHSTIIKRQLHSSSSVDYFPRLKPKVYWFGALTRGRQHVFSDAV